MLRKEKMPRLFQNGPSKEELAALARQRAFARDKVLGKRLADEARVWIDGTEWQGGDMSQKNRVMSILNLWPSELNALPSHLPQDASFGGWAKKEKPAPPPCETPEYEGMMQSEIFTAPPWEGCLVSHTKDYQKITKVHTYELSITYGCRACFEVFFIQLPPASPQQDRGPLTMMQQKWIGRLTSELHKHKPCGFVSATSWKSKGRLSAANFATRLCQAREHVKNISAKTMRKTLKRNLKCGSGFCSQHAKDSHLLAGSVKSVRPFLRRMVPAGGMLGRRCTLSLRSGIWGPGTKRRIAGVMQKMRNAVEMASMRGEGWAMRVFWPSIKHKPMKSVKTSDWHWKKLASKYKKNPLRPMMMNPSAKCSRSRNSERVLSSLNSSSMIDDPRRFPFSFSRCWISIMERRGETKSLSFWRSQSIAFAPPGVILSVRFLEADAR